MEDQQNLYHLLAVGSDAEVLAFLDTHRTCFWGAKATEWQGTISPEVLLTMRRWAHTPGFFRRLFPGAAKHVELWNHDDHGEPENIFKLHLFPRLAFGGGTTSDVGYPTVKRASIEVSDLPWLDFSGWGGILDFFFPGRLLSDSRLEVSMVGSETRGGWKNRKRWGYQYVSATWKKGRGNRSGVYVGTQWRKAQVLPGSELDEKSLVDVSSETGVSIENLKKRKGGKGWPMGVRTGIFGGHSFRRCFWSVMPAGCRLEGQFGIVVEPQGDPFSDVEQSLGARQNLRFQWGTTFSWNTAIARPKPWNH